MWAQLKWEVLVACVVAWNHIPRLLTEGHARRLTTVAMATVAMDTSKNSLWWGGGWGSSAILAVMKLKITGDYWS